MRDTDKSAVHMPCLQSGVGAKEKRVVLSVGFIMPVATSCKSWRLKRRFRAIDVGNPKP